MSTKYADHGAYANSCEFTGSLSAATLTVTAITSGKITLGANLTGVGINYPLTIISYGTGTGGAGTYVVANHGQNGTLALRTFYTDNGGPHNTPDWGVPQEGDGTTQTPATASATVSIDMSTWVLSTSSVVSIMGVNVTCTASATSAAESATPNAQYSATLTTMINNLVTAINFHGGLVVNRPAGWTQHKVRDSLFARRTGNSLELMTRSGSASWNGLTAATFASVTNASTQTWAGGSGGCWGWLVNTGTIWPSAITYLGYGLWCPRLPLAGSVDPGDVIVERGGKEIQMAVVVNQNSELNPAAMGTPYEPVTFVVDDASVWPGPANPVLKFRHHPYGTSSSGWISNQETYAKIKAKRYSPTSYGMVMESYQASVAALRINVPSFVQFEGVDFVATGGGYLLLSRTANGLSSVARAHNQFVRCRFRQPNQASSFVATNTDALRVDFIDTVFDCGSPSAPHTAGVLSAHSQYTVRQQLNFYGCKFVNFLVGSQLLPSSTPYNPLNSTYRFRNCDFGGVTVLGPNFSSVAMASLDGSNISQGGIATSQLGKRDFFTDTTQGWAAWVSTRSFPILNAVLPNGTDKWSIQVIPTTVVGNIGRHGPFEIPRIVKINTLPSAVRTLTVEVCIEQSLSWTKRDISLLVEYEDIDGVMQTIDTYDYDGSALTASNAAWNGVDATPTFSSAGTLYFNRYKWQITTPTAIKGVDDVWELGTEVGCVVRIHTAVANANQMAFVDPEITVA